MNPARGSSTGEWRELLECPERVHTCVQAAQISSQCVLSVCTRVHICVQAAQIHQRHRVLLQRRLRAPSRARQSRPWALSQT